MGRGRGSGREGVLPSAAGDEDVAVLEGVGHCSRWGCDGISAWLLVWMEGEKGRVVNIGGCKLLVRVRARVRGRLFAMGGFV